MSGVSFDEQAFRWLYLLWAVLGVAAVGTYGIWQRRRAMRAFASLRLVEAIAPPASVARPLTRLVLVVACLTLLVVALVNPRWGEVEQKVVRRGIDIMVLLDVSRSMLARDIAPNRLERAKLALRDDLLPALGGDRIGLIAFAGLPSLKCALTTDYGFFRLALNDIDTRSAPKGGTAIGDAIREAGRSFGGELGHHKVIVLITDGEDHDSYPVHAAEGVWDDFKIPIIALAMGDPTEGARIPVATKTGETYLEHDNEVVWSKSNFAQLREIVQVSDPAGGNFIPIGTKDFDIGEIYMKRVVRPFRHKEWTDVEQVRRPSRYYLFAAAALALLLIDSFLRDGPRPAANMTLRVYKRGEAA